MNRHWATLILGVLVLSGPVSMAFSAEVPGGIGPAGGSIYGGNLMTEEERQEFREKLGELDEEERETFFREHRQRIQERSQFFGVAPETGPRESLPPTREEKGLAAPPADRPGGDTGEVTPIPDEKESAPQLEKAPELPAPEVPGPDLREEEKQPPPMEPEPDPNAGIPARPKTRPEEDRRFQPGFGPAREIIVPPSPQPLPDSGPLPDRGDDAAAPQGAER